MVYLWTAMEQLALNKIANWSFILFHVGLIFFNLFGWIHKKTRRWNLLTLSLTAFSWFVLGIFYGWGYCFLTDWHWQVREKLGYPTESSSYIQFLIMELTGISAWRNLVDTFTAIFFFAAFILSIYFNVRKK